MKVRDKNTGTYRQQGEKGSQPGMILQLMHFDGSHEEFLHALLHLQCQSVHAHGGAIFSISATGEDRLCAIHPEFEESNEKPEWLDRLRRLVKEQTTTPLVNTKTVAFTTNSVSDGGATKQQAVILPLPKMDEQPLVAVFLIRVLNPVDLSYKRQRLELTGPLFMLREMRSALQGNSAGAATMQSSLSILSETNRMTRFRETAFSLCNSAAEEWGCSRVSAGFLKDHYVRLEAMSNVEKFVRKSDLVQSIEAAMEECLDQDLEVVHPRPAEDITISRAASELSRRHGQDNIISLPLRRQDKAVAVLTLERNGKKPFTESEIFTLRLTGELIAPRLLDLYEHDRWFGARMVIDARKAMAKVVGPKHTWIKLIAVAVFCALSYVLIGTSTYRISSSFALQTPEKQVVSAPFDGFISEVKSRPGDIVESGVTVLGKLDSTEMQLQLISSKAEILQYKREAATALRDGKTAEAKIAEAQAERIQSQADLLKYRIDNAILRAPKSGTVVSEDLYRRVGSPVKLGDPLFEIAPLENLHADLYVPEDAISDVEIGQKGHLAVVGLPGVKIGFTVVRIHPVAEVVGQRNVFRVEVKLDETPEWMKPGMEGVAKIDAGQRSIAWIWTRDAVNWLRMKLWM